jgi:integration host factor subunit beta
MLIPPTFAPRMTPNLGGQMAGTKTVTKSDLVEHLADSAKLPKGKAEMAVNTIFDSMVEALQSGERIEIRGFGSFEVRHYKSYEGRNPRTGETVRVDPKKLPFFKAGKELRERINKGTGELEGDGADGNGNSEL